MKPEELMSRPAVEFITEARAFLPTDRVSRVIGYMKESKVYEAFVEEDERTYAVSIRDLLDVVSLEERLSSLMHQVPRLTEHNNVGDAATLMFEYSARSMPLYLGGKLAGQVTSPSIVAKLVESSNLKLSALVTSDPITVAPSSPVSTAKELMRRKRIDQVPVVDEGVVGIVTSEEIVFNLIPKTDRDAKGDWMKGRYSEKVGIYSTKDVQTNEITDSPRDVYLEMFKRGSNYSLITNGGKLAGIVTYRDFMRGIARGPNQPALPMYIVGLPTDPIEAAEVRRKFVDAVQLLEKSLPDVGEARAVIKAGDGNAKTARRKKQVKVLILTPTRMHSFSTSSYSLLDAFDEVHEWTKKLVAKDKPARERPTRRREFPSN